MIKAVDTKNKILLIAHELFAKNGFHGTSIRDISTSADVNVAAINYHFQNKEKLYFEAFQQSYLQLDKEINIIAQASQTTEDFAWSVFEHMVNNGTTVVNTFKIILNSNFKFPQEFEEKSDRNFGPPGGEMMYRFLKADAPNAKENAVIWAVRGISTYIFHWAIMMNTSFCTEMKKNDPEYSMQAKQQHIRLHVRSLLDFINKNSQEF